MSDRRSGTSIARHPGLGLGAVVVVCATLLAAGRQQPASGQTLPPWTPGTLDIHQISTGRGNAALFVFPDGTTMLVDAGAAGDGSAIPDTEPRPNATRTSGAWIVDYIEQALAGRGAARLDYAVITHFHADHMGQITPASATSATGAYKLSGITEVGNRIPIATLIDRGAAFAPPPATDPTWRNYRAFVDDEQRHGLKPQVIRVGRHDQIAMRRQTSAYPTFDVRNVAANGDVWTGTGDAAVHVFPPLDTLRAEDLPSENMCSIALLVRYGRFDFFTGGDIPGVPDAGAPAWQSVETPVARAVGAVDVHVVNHHGSIDPESAVFLATLRSRVMILPSWSPTHPSQDVLKRMLSQRAYPGPRDVFATVLRESTRLSIGPRARELATDHGHIVIRVAPGGDSYRVFVLDDRTVTRAVLKSFGPYGSQ